MRLTMEELEAVNGNIMRIMENRVILFTGCDKMTANLVANEILDLDSEVEQLLNTQEDEVCKDEN